MSDNNSSGYAIRTDLLGMAIGILEAKKCREEANEHIQADNDKSYRKKSIGSYSTEDVIQEAEKLYGFVQKKQSSQPQGGTGLQVPFILT